jgi:hypothetical protein
LLLCDKNENYTTATPETTSVPLQLAKWEHFPVRKKERKNHRISLPFKNKIRGWGCSSEVEHLPSMCHTSAIKINKRINK